MSTEISNLNLARKWRPKTFDSIVGQDVPVRMLKNSLYLKKYFPVYLFAGQRGCGKTSTARVFAAAVNCHELDRFQIDPSIQIPCLECSSCKSMSRGNHPDFIEIDAASHTGVDNVRTIIESSSYLPLNGKKKIYLIDEAHMLSKAAFNAFLKILEEPPVSVLFILATTEIQKIPATVLSRCFQAIFTALPSASLREHLASICKQESVSIDDDALDLLIQETEGCARDALNLLERIRFSGEHISRQLMLDILGKISNQLLYDIFDAIIDRQPASVLEILMKNRVDQLNPTTLWDSIVYLIRLLVWVCYGVPCSDSRFSSDEELLKNFAQRCSINRLQALAQLLWQQEELFLKTDKKYLFIEMVLIKMCQKINVIDSDRLISSDKSYTGSLGSIDNQKPKESINSSSQIKREVIQHSEYNLQAKPHLTLSQSQVTEKPEIIKEKSNEPWDLFLIQLENNADQLLKSILIQARVSEFNEQTKILTIELSNKSSFFMDKIEETRSQWFLLLKQHFAGIVDVVFTASSNNTKQRPQQERITAPVATKQAPTFQAHQRSAPRVTQAASQESVINVQDKEKWPVSNLLLRHFPGTIKQSKVYS